VPNISIQQDFLTLKGGVNPGGIVYLRTPVGRIPQYRYQFSVDKGGSISEGYFY